MRHRTVRIIARDFEKLLLGFFVPERMQQRESMLKRRLLRRFARNWKVHRAQLPRIQLGMMFLIVPSSVKTENVEETQQPWKKRHKNLQVGLIGRLVISPTALQAWSMAQSV